MKDPHIHAEKTTLGMSLAFGKTLGTGCGKRRDKERTSTDPAEVTCLPCREWAAADETELAEMADAAAGLDEKFLAENGGRTPEYFQELARQHRAKAQEWSSVFGVEVVIHVPRKTPERSS